MAARAKSDQRDPTRAVHRVFCKARQAGWMCVCMCTRVEEAEQRAENFAVRHQQGVPRAARLHACTHEIDRLHARTHEIDRMHARTHETNRMHACTHEIERMHARTRARDRPRACAHA
eukprot:360830-Chlamydomonas_euryale.AAC.2